MSDMKFKVGDKVKRIAQFDTAHPPFEPEKVYTVTSVFPDAEDITLEGYPDDAGWWADLFIKVEERAITVG